jgi:hypothetical protein
VSRTIVHGDSCRESSILAKHTLGSEPILVYSRWDDLGSYPEPGEIGEIELAIFEWDDELEAYVKRGRHGE